MTQPSLAPTGLCEAHAHLAQHGRAMGMEPMEGCHHLGECLDRIRRAAGRLRMQGAPFSHWLLAVGLRTEAWTKAVWPTAAELDEAAGPRPVCIWSFDHHALVVNTAAMRAVGLAPDVPDPEGGRIVRDAAGRPTGVMLEAAAKKVWGAIPEPMGAARRANVAAAAMDLAAHGFSEVHELLAPAWLGESLAELRDAGQLPLRVWVYPRFEELDVVAAAATKWERPGLRLAGAKLFADGTLNSRTAWMLAPYADPLPGLAHGQPMLSVEQLKAAMTKCWSMGLGLAVHAIGDGAVRAVLDACESLPASLRNGVRDGLPALRIEHAEIIDAADVPRFSRLGVVCSVQPCHLLADIEALQRGLPHRLDRVLPLRELIDSGCRPGELLWFGSDTPIVRPHPHDSIQAATQRRREGMPAAAAIAPEQAITEEEAWQGFRNDAIQGANRK